MIPSFGKTYLPRLRYGLVALGFAVVFAVALVPSDAEGARLFTSGFETNNFAETEWQTTPGSSASIVTSPVHGGGFALRVTTSDNVSGVERRFPSVSSGTLLFRFYVRFVSFPASAVDLFSEGSPGANNRDGIQVIFVNGTNVLRVRNAVTGTTNTASTTLQTARWYRIEARHLFADSGGEMEVRLFDGESLTATETFSITGEDTLPTSNVDRFHVGLRQLANTAQAVFDDVAFNDDTGSFQNSWPGSGRVVLVKPTFDHTVNWTPNPSGSNAANVDDEPGTPDDDTTYNGTSGANTDRLYLSDLPTVMPPTATLTLAHVMGRARSESGTQNLSFRWWNEQGAEIAGPTFSFGTSYEIPATNEMLVVDLSTSTRTHLITSNIGYAWGAGTVRITALWANVEYTGDIPGGRGVTSRSDILSDSRPSQGSNHTITFTTQSAVMASSTMEIRFPADFSFPSGLDCGDVDVATSVEFTLSVTSIGCEVTATNWGISFAPSPPTLIITSPTSTGSYISTGTVVTIKIGTNATSQQTGTTRITNPATAGSYTINVGGTFGGSGGIAVQILSGLTVEARVAEHLTVAITGAPYTTSDDFNRADGDLGANWSAVGTQAKAVIRNNAAGTDVDSQIETGVWTARTFAGDQYAQATVVSTGSRWSVVVRGSTSADTLYAAGMHLGFSGSNRNRRIWKNVGGTETSLTEEGDDVVAGDVIRLEVEGTALRMYVNGSLRLSTTDSAISSGQPGLWLRRTTADVGMLDDWSAGEIGCIADDGASANSVTTTATSVPFGNVSANTFYQGCQDIEVSTNAGLGYTLTASMDHPLRTQSGQNIADTNCDSGCDQITAGTWTTPSNTGFGHTCRNQTGNDCNTEYANGTKFRRFFSLSTGGSLSVKATTGTYTGNGTARTISHGLGTTPKVIMLWLDEDEENAGYVLKTDQHPSATSIQFPTGSGSTRLAADMITGMNSTTFSLGTASSVNQTSSSYMWIAYAGNGVGTGAYAGNGNDNRNIAHGIGTSPKMLFVWRETNNTTEGMCARSDQYVGDISVCWQTRSQAALSIVDLIQAMDGTNFQVGTQSHVNGNGVAYKWFAFAGPSIQTGSYTGNGQDNRNVAHGLSATPTLTWVWEDDDGSVNSPAVRSNQYVGDVSISLDLGGNPTTRAADYIQALSATSFQVGTEVAVNGSAALHKWFAVKTSGAQSEGAGETLMASSTPVNIAVGRVKYRLSVPSSQASGTYRTLITFTAVPRY